jgi:hypothetical protein
MIFVVLLHSISKYFKNFSLETLSNSASGRVSASRQRTYEQVYEAMLGKNACMCEKEACLLHRFLISVGPDHFRSYSSQRLAETHPFRWYQPSYTLSYKTRIFLKI